MLAFGVVAVIGVTVSNSAACDALFESANTQLPCLSAT